MNGREIYFTDVIVKYTISLKSTSKNKKVNGRKVVKLQKQGFEVGKNGYGERMD